MNSLHSGLLCSNQSFKAPPTKPHPIIPTLIILIVNYINYEDGFWNGKAFHDGFYSGVGFGSKIAIYKDFYEYDIYINRFRDLIDCSRRPIRVRRGWRRDDYELIIITSVQNPKDIYKEYPEEDRRRILESITEIIDLTPKNN